MAVPGVFTLHGALHRAASTWPQAEAVRDGRGSWSFEELAERAGRAATALRELGVAPSDRVGVLGEKTAEAVASLYGTMAAGAAYVPVDPKGPPRRAVSILDDAGVAAVFADAPGAQRLAGTGWTGAPIIPMGPGVEGAGIDADEIDGLEPDGLGGGCEADLAYLLYTSGSTGQPKGVMLSHRNALAFAEWGVWRFQVGRHDVLANHAPFHFDLSVFDIYGAALAGAPVRLIEAARGALGRSMLEVLQGDAITVWYSVPSALVLLCDAAQAGDLDRLRVILFAGEVFPMKHLRRLRALAPDAVMANLYGPTETNVCTYHVVPHELPPGDQPLPIGIACENQEVFALGSDGRPVPPGEEGVLWARGPTVMQGYWNDDEKTRSVRRQNPLHDRFPDPAMCTGDLVRRRPDGAYDFLGRRDHQIKTRGFRVELGEIETALVSHDAVREAVVVAIPDDDIGHRLVAFASTDGTDLDEMTLKRHCAERLPRYMIPATIEVLDELPHTSTGKADRQSLRQRVEGGFGEDPS